MNGAIIHVDNIYSRNRDGKRGLNRKTYARCSRSARDNVRSLDNFRPIYTNDRLCAIMVGQNVRARAITHA